MKRKNGVERIGVRFGLLTAAGFIGLFLLMRVVGLAEVTELRLLNAFILLAGIAWSIKRLKKTYDGPLRYLNGLSCGVLTALVGVTTFCLFIFAYLQFFDPAFMAAVNQNEMFGEYLNPFTAALAIFFEGAFSGALMAFCIMQYLKDSLWEEMDNEETEERLQGRAPVKPTMSTNSQPRYTSAGR